MAIRSIDHVQLAMPPGGEAAGRQFYEELLGLSHQEKPPALAARGGCWFETAGVRVHLGVESDFRPARKAHPAFVVDDLAALTERLRRAGVELVDAEPLDGYDRLHAFDPFGNRIELMEHTDG